MSSLRISTQSTFGNRCAHLLGGHRPGVPGFDHTTYRRSREFRQQDYTAIGMHEELNPITRLQPKMFTDRLRNGGLALDGDRGWNVSGSCLLCLSWIGKGLPTTFCSANLVGRGSWSCHLVPCPIVRESWLPCLLKARRLNCDSISTASWDFASWDIGASIFSGSGMVSRFSA